MTWEELKEKAKENAIFGPDGFSYKGLSFRKDGSIWKDNYNYWVSICIAEHRTPEQMLMIMRGLE